jgi:Rieske Fe-S protein
MIEVKEVEPTRRQFCAQACYAASLTALASILDGCGGGSNPMSPSGMGSGTNLPVIGASVVSNTFALAIDATSPLAGVGTATLVQTSSGNFLVAHTGQNDFIALTAVCTHQSCTITGFDNQVYVCPCHGSRYNTSGQVLSGPAPRALTQYITQFTNNVLTVTIA